MYSIKESIFNAYFFWKLFAKILAPRDIIFVSTQNYRIVELFPVWGKLFLTWMNGAVDRFLYVKELSLTWYILSFSDAIL